MPSALTQSSWQPKEILRWVRGIPSSTSVAVVVTDLGEGRSEVEDAVQSIPPDWHVGNRAKAALVEFLTARAAYVAEHIMDWIWPQVEFDFMNEAEDHS